MTVYTVYFAGNGYGYVIAHNRHTSPKLYRTKRMAAAAARRSLKRYAEIEAANAQ